MITCAAMIITPSLKSSRNEKNDTDDRVLHNCSEFTQLYGTIMINFTRIYSSYSYDFEDAFTKGILLQKQY